MNERIKELYRQAHSIRYHDSDPMREGNPPTVYWQGEVSAQRFAELIVRECANICMEMSAKCAGLPGDGALAKDCAYWIKKDFGVEE